MLIVEDDGEIVDLLRIHLGDLGLQAEAADSGADALSRFREGEFALVLLDIMLPEMDGLEVCRRIRSIDRRIPILMLTARTEELDKVLGLEVGADDYVTKPFGIRELMARVRALLRRVEEQGESGGKDGGPMHFGPLLVDPAKRKVSLEGEPIDLTAKEYEVLLTLCRRPGQAFSRTQLLETVWGYQYDGYSHTVNSHINRLRNKIEKDPSRPRFIETVWGYGYRFSEGWGR